MSNIPDLIIPKSGEVYMKLVDNEWNLAGGCNGAGNNSSQLTNHWEWLFESAAALQKDDICILGGDYILTGLGGPPRSNLSGYDDGNYYIKGINGLLTEAMARGAKVLLLTDRYYSGGCNGAGKSAGCSDNCTPWDSCSSETCWKTGLYCGTSGWCEGCTMGQTTFNPTSSGSLAYNAKQIAEKNKDTYNFISYDIQGVSSDTSHPHCHVKLISFYYNKTDISPARFSVFKGGWNMSTWQYADQLKETGMGITGLISDDIGKLFLAGDIGHLRAFENNFDSKDYYVYVPDGKTQTSWYGSDINPIKMSQFLFRFSESKNPDSPPMQPVNIPKVYFMGPSFGKYYSDFGCGAINSGRTALFKCSGNEGWVKITETNVNIVLGYAPMPQGKCKFPVSVAGGSPTCWSSCSQLDQDKWSQSGNNWPAMKDPVKFNAVSGPPQVGFPFALDVIDDFITSSKYMKTLMHSQLLGDSVVDSDPTNCWGAVKCFSDTIINFTQKNNWYTLTNPDMTSNPNSNSLGFKVKSSNWYHRFYTGCGLASGTINTHDKLWIGDKGFIMASGHPVGIHYSAYLTNDCLLFTNAPNLTAYMNQHFNTLYFYGDPVQILDPSNNPAGNTSYIQPSDLCPGNIDSDGLCMYDPNCVSINRRVGWETFTDMPSGNSPKPSHSGSPYPKPSGSPQNQDFSDNATRPFYKQLWFDILVLLVVSAGLYLLLTKIAVPFGTRIIIVSGIIILVSVILALITYSKTTNTTTNTPKNTSSPTQKPKKVTFVEVPSLLNKGGLCRAKNETFPYFAEVDGISRSECEKMCLDDSSCNSYNYGTFPGGTRASCQMYSYEQKPGYSYQTSDGWKSSNDFPYYSSPYICSVPLNKDPTSCYTAYGKDVCSDVSDMVCMTKSTNLPDFYWGGNDNCKKYNTCQAASDMGLNAVISNPYMPSGELLICSGNFFFWFYNMIKNSKKYCFIINSYWTLGKFQSNSVDDYQSRIFLEIVDALSRGVTFFVVHSGQSDDTCTTSVANQPMLKQYIKTVNVSSLQADGSLNLNKKMNLISTNNIFFFHDKIYLNENQAYIGGQNASGSSSIDFGVEIPKGTSLYEDLMTRCKYFVSLGKPSVTLKFITNENTPFVSTDTGTKYYIGLSPVSDLNCTSSGKNCSTDKKNICTYPQIPPTTFNRIIENVSFEWYHLYNIITKAKKWLFITNYEMSPYSQYYKLVGTSFMLLDELLNAAKRISKTSDPFSGVQLYIDNAIHFTPDVSECPGVTNCEFLRCLQSQTWLSNMSEAGASINWWYSDPRKNKEKPDFGKGWNCNADDYNCKTLHAKIYYSDYGILITSSNFTQSYFAGTEDTGLCAIFNNQTPPHWISQGVLNMKSILDKNKNTCAHSSPNTIDSNDKDFSNLCTVSNGKTYCCACYTGNVSEC